MIKVKELQLILVLYKINIKKIRFCCPNKYNSRLQITSNLELVSAFGRELLNFANTHKFGPGNSLSSKSNGDRKFKK